jgi:hypothetical protein
MAMKMSHRLIARTAPAVAAAIALAATGAWAQQDVGKQLVGTWKLVSSHTTGADGVRKVGSYGPNPAGLLILASNGHYASVQGRPDLPRLASNNRIKGTPEEYKAIVQGSVAQFGTYSVDPPGKTITYKVRMSTFPNWAGTEQKRELILAGDELKFTFTGTYGQKAEQVMKRVK